MNATSYRILAAHGDLPQPVLIDGKERWRLVEIKAVLGEVG